MKPLPGKGLLAHISYAVLAFGAVSGALLTPGHVVGDGIDLFGTFWFYWWIADCAEALRDPSFTDLMFHPLGKDIFAHTGNNFLDALLSIPLQEVFGYPRYQPWFVGLLLWGNALAFRPLARRVVGDGWAGHAATALWMLNPFILFECMTGRLTQALLWFMPLALWAFLACGDAQTPRRRWGLAVAAGLLTALQGYTYWYAGYFTALALAVLALAELKTRWSERRRLLAGWAAAGVACALAVAPAGLAMADAASAGDVPGLSEGGSIFEGPPAVANNVAASLHGAVKMERFGQPMLTTITWAPLALLAALGSRRWASVAAAGAVFAIGPSVQVPGLERALILPHYMAAYHHLPFFDRLWFPYRLMSVVFLALSLSSGLLLTRLGRAALPVGLALLALAGAEQHRNLAYPLLHRDLTPPSVYRWLGEQGGGLIELPQGMARISIAWQPVHGQPTFGGMGENARVLWPEGYHRRLSGSFIRFLKTVTRDPERARAPRPGQQALLEAEGFRWVVMNRHLVDSQAHAHPPPRLSAAAQNSLVFRAQAAISAQLGAPTAVEGPRVVWDLRGTAIAPPDLAPTAEGLAVRTWPTHDMPAYEAHLRERGRIP